MKHFINKILLVYTILLLGFYNQLNAQCTTPNTSRFPTATINAGTGAVVTIANNSWEGEYAQITGIINGARYRFTINNATSIITVRVGTSNGAILGSGVGAVTVTATSASDLYIHFNTASCGNIPTDRVTTVQAIPRITSLGATSGCAGSTIVINGNNFTGITGPNVTIGGTAVTAINSLTSTQIIATVGAGTTGTVSVTNTAGTGSFGTSYTVIAAPINRTFAAQSATVCTGSGTNIQVVNSETGVNYFLRDNATNIAIGGSVAGNGGTINLPTGNLSATTTYNILATRVLGGCSIQLTGTVTVTINGPTVTAGPNVSTCSSLTPPPITLSGSSIGGTATTGAWSLLTPGAGTLSSTAQTTNPSAVTFTVADNYVGTITLRLTTNIPSGCGAVSATRNIVVNAKPTPVISANHCIGSGIVRLTSSGPYSSYLWNLTGQTTQSIDVITAGNYFVTVTDANGCQGTDAYVTGTELVTNGDFNAGNTGFTTNYVYTPNIAGNTELYPEGYYAVGADANQYHNAFNGTDHTTGNGNFMIINGTVTADRLVWSQNNIAVTPNTTYYFSAWGLSVVNGNNAILRFSINGTQIGSSATLPNGYSNPSGPFNWVRFFGSWNSGSATVANLSIVNNQLAAGGNDFGLDDISFSNLPPLTLAATPTSATAAVCAGTALNLFGNIAGGNYPLTYAWTGPNSFTSTSLNPTIASAAAANAGVYNLTVTDRFGCTASGSTSAVTVNPVPTITTTGIIAARCFNTGSQTSNLAYSATTNSPNRYSITWSAAANTAGLVNVVDASLPASNIVIDIPASLATATYTGTLFVTNANGCVSSNTTISLTINAVPSMTSANSASICTGGTVNIPLTTSVASTYSWIAANNTSVTGESVSTQSTATLNNTLTNISAVGQDVVYTVTPTSTAGACIGSSQTVTVRVNVSIANNTVTSAQNICNGVTPTALTGTTPTGGNGTYTYVWESSTTSAVAGFSTASGTNNGINYSPSALFQNTWYRRVVSSGGCTSTSLAIAITVDPVITTNTIGTSQTICTGSTPTSLTGSSPAGGNGAYTYLWESSTTSAIAGFAAASGTNNTINYAPSALTQTTWYRRTITSGGCTSASPTVLITVNPVIGNHVVSAAQSICSGSTPSSLTNTNPTGGNGTYSYVWQSSTTSAVAGFAAASGSNLFQNYNPTALTQTTWFRTTITSGGCSSVATAIEITVTPSITNNTIGSDQSICTATTPAGLTGAAAAGGNGVYTYQWQSSIVSATFGFAAATGTNNLQNYTPGVLTQTTWYRRVVTSGACSNTSSVVTITVNAAIGNNTITAAQTICSGNTPNALTGSTPSGGNSTYTYLWESSTTSALAGFSAASGTNNTISYIPGALTQNTWYRRTVTSGGCSNTSTAIAITVNPVLANNTIGNNQTICAGSVPATLTGSTPTGATGAYTYLWQSSTTSAIAGFVTASGTSNGINYTPAALSVTTWYRRTVTSGTCTNTSTVIAIAVNPSGQWTGAVSSDWNNASNWCGGIPTSSSNVIIPAGATVNIQSANAVAGSVTIAGTGSLVMTGAHNLTITAGGTFTNNGTFTATSSTGAVVFAGAGTIAGTTSFQNIQTSGALNFGTASTVNGNFTIQTGGSVTGNAPTYTCPSSTLIYRTGGTFARGIEWATNPTGQGYPSNVLVQSNTIINFPIPGQGYVCNDLTIEDGSVLNQNFASGSASLQVGRNVTIAGTLTLGGASGGDLNVGGNWTRTSTGVFNHNERKVTFDGTGNFSGRGLAMSTISAPASSFKDNEGGFGGEKFAHLWMNKAAATDSLVLLSNVTITREIGFTRGTFSLRNSDVTLVSNTTRTADIAPVTTPANVAVRYAGTGRFNIQRFVHNPTAVRSWRLLTAPVEAASAPSINTAWQYGTVNPDRTNPTGADGIYNPWPGYGTHITGPGGTYNLASGFDHGTNSASILQATANVAGWVAPANTKGTLVTDQQGWMLFVRGDRGYAIGSQYTPSQSTTLETRGKVLIGDVVRPVAAGRQVIANPYASAISLANIDLSGTGNTNANVYYTWDPKFFTSYTQPGKWVTFTRAGSTFVSTTSASNYSNTGVIESGQAFVIQPSVAGNVTFKESDKLPLTSSLIGVANRPTNQTFGMLRSDLYVNNGGVFTLTDAVVNLFDEDYTNTVDEEDANKLITFNTKESLSLQRDTSKLAIEKRSKIVSTDTIYYSLSKLNELPYQFRFKASNIPVGLTAYVEDKFTNSRTVVNLNGETIVDFTITADPLSKVMDRFKMVFKLQGPLPVKITTLTATKQSNSKVAVDWKVESETNVSSYYIEKSTDGIHFSTVAVENAYGNNTRFATYQWLDTKPFNGRNFYRLKVLDFDGTFTYSQIVQVSFDNKSTISIFPNPIVNNETNVQINNDVSGKYTIKLLNSIGQVLLTKGVQYNGGALQIPVMIDKNMAKGIYQVEVINPNNTSTMIKIMNQ